MRGAATGPVTASSTVMRLSRLAMVLLQLRHAGSKLIQLNYPGQRNE